MFQLLTIIGARPQIIKAAAISRAIREGKNDSGIPFAQLIHEDLLHTGQHYDDNMSAVFFRQLGIPDATYNLGVGSGNHGEQTAKMISGIEKVLMQKHYDGVLIYGDTNSTLAAAVAAAKMHVPIFHVESGLRSYDMSMPEEQNRIVADHLSNILFAPTATAVGNLAEEGLISPKARFANGKRRIVFNSGDVMYDNALYFSTIAREKSTILANLNLASKDYILATLHRDSNTDNPKRLTSIFTALLHLAADGEKIVLPLHPRTRNRMQTNLPADLLSELEQQPNLKIIPPASFFDILMLEQHAKVVITDSGGVQKEAFFFSTPSVILRQETEWVEIIEANAGVLADADTRKIIDSVHSLQHQTITFPPLFGDGHAAEKILNAMLY